MRRVIDILRGGVSRLYRRLAGSSVAAGDGQQTAGAPVRVARRARVKHAPPAPEWMMQRSRRGWQIMRPGYAPLSGPCPTQRAAIHAAERALQKLAAA